MRDEKQSFKNIAVSYLRRPVWFVRNGRRLVCFLIPLVPEDFRRRRRKGVLLMNWSLYGGGSERVTSILASEFCENYDVTVLSFEQKKAEYALSPKVKRLYIPNFGGRLEARQQMTRRLVRRTKKLLRIRASVSMMYAMNRLNVQAGAGDVVICSERNSPAKREPEHMPSITAIYTAANHVVFQSETVRNQFPEAVRAHSSIIPNPVSVTCMRAENTRHKIVNIGRLHPQKNQKLLLQAFSDFYRSHPEYELCLYGQGKTGPELETLAQELGIRDSVRFCGHTDRIHEAVADAEMFVLSSDYEGMSNALLECMMMGIPCISTACEGSTDVIRDHVSGLLTPVGDRKSLAEAMQTLAEDPALRERLAREGQKTAEGFRKETVVRQWEMLIEQCMKQREK